MALALVPALWGIALALGVAMLGRLAGFDRERAFYPLALLVIASYYELFAAMGDRSALLGETIVFLLFAGAAVVGFRTSLWVTAAALAAHGILDFFHHGIVANLGVPDWWPSFCMAYDVAAALCLAALLRFSPPARR